MAATPSAAPPRSPRRSRQTNVELASWLFMRLSGLALLVLALGHLGTMHLIATADTMDYAFVADRWKQPLWRVYDLLLLVLALWHGANGARIVLDDYLPDGPYRAPAVAILGATTLLFTLIGAITILVFPVAVPPPAAG